ncbi:MAG: peptidase S9 [Fimbriimonadales bacterium]|nr:MAG: peptidase S9 [Fimbriimonadales bacterium]
MRYFARMVRRLAIVASFVCLLGAQSRLPQMPGYDRWLEMRPKIQRSVVRGDLTAVWSEDGKAFYYRKEGAWRRFDVETLKETEVEGPPERPSPPRDTRPRPARGRQYTVAYSQDGEWQANYVNGNVVIRKRSGGDEIRVTTDGDKQKRIEYGTASWVYGEELNQNEAMWWSPDSKKLAYYRIDNRLVPDYYVTLDLTQVHNRLYVEPYPKAGDPNPILDLFIYDRESGKSVPVDVRDGKPFSNDVVGHYVYNVRWSPNGKELLFHRTNRRQNVMEFCAADPSTGKVRVILREEWPTGWVTNSPTLRWLDDHRFLWVSERNGYANFYLYDLSGKLLSTVTRHEFEVVDIVQIEGETLWYTARSGDNPYKIQLHRVHLDGTGDQRLTDPKFHHTINLAPGGKYFLDTFETASIPPKTVLRDATGKQLAVLAESDLTEFERLKLQPTEVFTFLAADGKTVCYGTLDKPSDFDPTKKYPLLVSVYAGPDSGGVREVFSPPNAMTEFGFLVASIHGRNASGLGKHTLDSLYLKLGLTEIDDQAAGVRELAKRPYVDGSRVGIFGTSYGGYASLMCLLRYPDVFAAACASASVTDWRNYDSIYTERYMWIPQENEEGYRNGSAMTYAANLKGALMLFHGTADDNVHLANSVQLIQALQRAGKSFEVQLGPDQGHAGIRFERMMEFFIENLVMKRDTNR